MNLYNCDSNQPIVRYYYKEICIAMPNDCLRNYIFQKSFLFAKLIIFYINFYENQLQGFFPLELVRFARRICPQQIYKKHRQLTDSLLHVHMTSFRYLAILANILNHCYLRGLDGTKGIGGPVVRKPAARARVQGSNPYVAMHI